VSNVVHLIDPLTGQTATLEPEVFWRDPIRPLVTAARARLTRYVVLGKEAVFLRQNVSKRTVTKKQKSRLASLTLARESDFGHNDTTLEERSHVGYLLKAGDVCLGYDLKETQFVDDDAERQRTAGNFPDVVVVRKLYGTAARGSESQPMRQWRLQRLDVIEAETNRRKAATENADAMDEEDFLQEVEADKDMRVNMNLYRHQIVRRSRSASMDTEDARSRDGAGNVGGDDESDSDDQKVTLEELLDGLNLDEGRDAEDEEGTEMVPTYGEGEKAHQDGIGYIAREQARGVREKDTAVSVANGTLGDDFFGKL
jgi:nonsense-mediated mRNA decay protein 3